MLNYVAFMLQGQHVKMDIVLHAGLGHDFVLPVSHGRKL